MAQFQAFTSGVEVSGQAVLSIVEWLGAFRETGLNILAENGIHNPKSGQWYSQQSWLDAFKTIAGLVGDASLFYIGENIPEKVDWPSGINSIEEALASIDKAYHLNHRGGEIGNYAFQKTSDRSGKMVCCNPYPCDFDRGIIEAIATEFKSRDLAFVKVEHDNSQPCRKNGADSCTYTVAW